MNANPMDELMTCGNEECGLVVPLRDCGEFQHGSRPFCPNCREVVEATGAYDTDSCNACGRGPAYGHSECKP